MSNSIRFSVDADQDAEILLNTPMTKYNTSIVLTPEDKRAGVKILCKEPYAQELYNLYANYSGGNLPVSSKDLTVGQICEVVAKQVDFEAKQIIAQDEATLTSIYIPFREFSQEPALLIHGEADREFKVVIYKNDNGEFLGSERRCSAISHREDLEEFQKTDQWFYIKVNSLVKGGYLCTYKSGVKCFLPGSHAAANVIRDFNDYLNKDIPVMIENYDASNDLFIVSYKKYIKHTLPERIHELSFSEKYVGELTNKPYDFGMFIEFQNYFTGLLHKTEFADYAKETANYKSGDKIEFYIKDIVIKKGEPRIILTTSPELINPEKATWQQLKIQAEGKEHEFEFDKEDFTVNVLISNSHETFKIDVSHLKGRTKIPNSGLLRINKVDAIRNNIKFDFLQD
jgi:predicted RNA-binding protein with RPS1 domain